MALLHLTARGHTRIPAWIVAHAGAFQSLSKLSSPAFLTLSVTNDDGTKVLVANMTLTDPKFYTEPITATKKWAFLPGVRLLPYECNEPTWEEHLDDLRRQSSTAPAAPDSTARLE